MDLYLSILLPSIFTLFALYKSKLTIPSFILAWVIGFIVAYFGGLYAFIALSLTSLLAIVSDNLKKTTKDKTRNIYQIISSLLTPALCIILYYILEHDGFYIIYYAVIGVSLADILASSVGNLSKKKPVNIFTFEKTERGASGGVTILGIIASIFGGIIISLIFLIHTLNYAAFLFIIILSVLGSLIDSALGIAFQAQYRCIACKKVIETNNHCRKKAKLIRGMPFINNNLVNLLSNIIIFLISYLLLI